MSFPDIFFISDHHLFHKNILTFLCEDEKTLTRPGFDNIDHMHEFMVEQHNSVVKESSIVYFLGDLTTHYGPKAQWLLQRFNGKKRFIPGNHDDLTKHYNLYKEFFKKIIIWRIFKEYDFVCSHVPLHPGSFRKVHFNMHGHTHTNLVKDINGAIDLRYLNVCVEQLNCLPMHLEEVLSIIKKRKKILSID